MARNGWYIQRENRSSIRNFIEKWHYSKSINGCIADYCYSLRNPDGTMMGALFYGRLAMANQWKRFGDSIDDVIELRRLCCVDDTPRNAESFLIGRSLKKLAEDWTGKVVVSYADAEFGHAGTIYKASNFEYLGHQKGAKVIVHGDKTYHDKAIRTKHKGKLKPFAQKLKNALDLGEAYYKDTKGKHCYTYKLKRKSRVKPTPTLEDILNG